MYVLQKLRLGRGGISAEENVNVTSELLRFVLSLQLRAAYELAENAFFDVVSANERRRKGLYKQVVDVLQRNIEKDKTGLWRRRRLLHALRIEASTAVFKSVFSVSLAHWPCGEFLDFSF